MADWPAHNYPAVKSNPFALMSHDTLFRFVTCAETEQEITATAGWLCGLKTGNRPLCVYKDGKPFRIIR